MNGNGRDTITILVVDDEEAVLNAMRRVLRADGFESVLICKDPRDVEPLLEALNFSLAVGERVNGLLCEKSI